MSDTALHDLARAAGIEINWRNINGYDSIVPDDSLRTVLGALGFSAASFSQIRESQELLREEANDSAWPLITADINQPVSVAGVPGRFRITLESGFIVEGMAMQGPNGALSLPVLNEPGYHRLELNDGITTIAVAPRRAYTLDDIAQGQKLWGLSLQLYALRQQGDGGIGDFSALAKFAVSAAAHGADALAISPVHAQFSADPTRFSPYAPSNRAALNVLHIAEPGAATDIQALVDWPVAGAAKLRALRLSFENFHDHEALAAFRHELGAGLERHALFEAIQAALTPGYDHANDWRQWPEAYRNPENPAVMRFLEQNAHEVSFHAYLQYRADKGLQAAQRAARDAGMRVGLIADLAVGMDPTGSQSWSCQNEVLCGLEIGAPPDAINHEGQDWRITAFSPRGLRNSGFSAFIEMIRHALRHTGGLRIDHVMGLERLWVIPQGGSSQQGAYLRLPVDDLLRLVVLKSYRHKAVILGEDLGTLPDGFQDRLDKAGISGLRVMWFERSGRHFNPPSTWTKTAVAMTTTHDLPTVSGWWQGKDIEWRVKLGMGGDSLAKRETDREELWEAFKNSGVTDAPIPAPDEGSKVADAACGYLGLASCTLALLPIEDALAKPEQPNLPGTADQYPNWRWRLPATADELLNWPDVAARLAALAKARTQT